MRTKYAGDNLTFYTKLTIIAANVTALVFLITAFFLAVSFPADGFEQAASALQFAPTSWSIIWTTISFGLNLGGVLYHPGIDIAFEIISIGLAFGMVWILIWWVDTIKRYGYSCYPSQDDCTETKGEALIASQIIASILILLSGLLHILLFVKACRAVHVKRKLSRKDRDSFHELDDQTDFSKA